MTKDEFMRQLTAQLNGAAPEERNRILQYYSEIIFDGMENGQSEEVVIAGLDSPQKIAAQLVEARPGADRMAVYSGGPLREIRVSVQDQGVEVIPSLDGVLRIHYKEHKGDVYTISEEGGTAIFTHTMSPFSRFLRGIFIGLRQVTVEIPREFGGRLTAVSTNAGLRIIGLPTLTDAVFKTSNGAVDIRDSSIGGLTARTSNSSLSLTNCGIGRAELSTSNGKLACTDIRAAEEIRTTTSNAGLNLTNVEGPVISAHTSNGTLRLVDITGESIKAATANASLYFSSVSASRELTGDSSNGKIQLEGGISSPRIRLHTSNASIRGTVKGDRAAYSLISRTTNGSSNLGLYDNPALPCRLEATTSNAPIQIDFKA